MCLLPPATNDDECTPDSPGYRGHHGHGQNRKNFCEQQKTECEEDGGTHGYYNGEEICLPPEYGAPTTCKSDTLNLVLIVNASGSTTGSGFACERLEDQPEPDTPDPEPNTDTTGDGIPDEYRRENDPDATNKGLDGVANLISESNRILQNIDNRVKGITNDGIPGTGGNGGSGGGSGDGNGDGDGDGDGDSSPITWSGDAINTDFDGPGEAYDEALANYQAAMTAIRNEVADFFSANLGGGGSVDDDTRQVFGVDVNFSFNRFLDGFNIIGSIILFIAAFISAGILFTGRG